MRVHWACIIIYYAYETRALFSFLSMLACSLSLSIYIHLNICIFQLLNSIWYRSKMQSKKFDDNWTDTHFVLILHDDNGPEYTYDRVVLITSDSLPPHSPSKYLCV